MKKTMILVTLLMGVLVGQSQTDSITPSQVTVTTETLNDCKWNDSTEHFDKNCIYKAEESSRFVFNKEVTMIVHTTNDMTSTYYIDGVDHQLEDDRAMWVYYVTSDVGNLYVFMFDMAYGEVRIIPKDGGYMLTAIIKARF